MKLFPKVEFVDKKLMFGTVHSRKKNHNFSDVKNSLSPTGIRTRDLSVTILCSKKRPRAKCLKITEKVLFNIASEASYVHFD